MMEPSYFLIIAAIVLFVQVSITLFSSFESIFTLVITNIALWLVYAMAAIGYGELSNNIEQVKIYGIIIFFAVKGLATYVRKLRNKLM